MPEFMKNTEGWQALVGTVIAIVVALGSFINSNDAQHEANSARAMASVSQEDMREIFAQRAKVDAILGQLQEKVVEIDSRIHRMDDRVESGDRELVTLVKEVMTDFRLELNKADARGKEVTADINKRYDRVADLLVDILDTVKLGGGLSNK